MARLSVKHWIRTIPNGFRLALLAAERARQLSAGDSPAVPPGDEPRTVVALREIAAGAVDPDRLRQAVVGRLQRERTAIEAGETESDAFAERFSSAGLPGAGLKERPQEDKEEEETREECDAA